jgi:hypothetical protein
MPDIPPAPGIPPAPEPLAPDTPPELDGVLAFGRLGRGVLELCVVALDAGFVSGSLASAPASPTGVVAVEVALDSSPLLDEPQPEIETTATRQTATPSKNFIATVLLALRQRPEQVTTANQRSAL